jgi:choloylglycine hydrolase
VGVLTNAPPFDEQMRHLASFMHLSPHQPHNHIYPESDLPLHSLGMGAMGLPGDLSSPSRFVRAVFTKGHAEIGGAEQFFHLLDTVRQTRGCCYTEEGALEFTRYSSCCDTLKCRYCYVTDSNRRIVSIAMDRENLEDNALRRWKLLENEDILLQN